MRSPPASGPKTLKLLLINDPEYIYVLIVSIGYTNDQLRADSPSALWMHRPIPQEGQIAIVFSNQHLLILFETYLTK